MGIWSDIAEWRGPTPNHSGAMLEQRGVVLHIAEGGYEGTISWCKNPASGVSCHFVVAADGRIAQLADTDVTVWTQIAGNGHWISVENEGFTPNALSDAQVRANARILAKAHQVYGVPLQVATDPTGRGLGHHSMGTDGGDNPTDTWTGPTWGHTDCPGPAIVNQKSAIIAIAGGDMGVEEWAASPGANTWALTQGAAGYAGQQRDTALAFAWQAAHEANDKADQALSALAEIKTMVAALAPGNVELTPEQVAQISGAAHDGAASAIDGATISSATISTAH